MDFWMNAATLLTLLVIFVNGWTDAPNAITTVVATGGLAYRQAASLAALCNFFGVVLMTCIRPAVIGSICGILDLSQLRIADDPGRVELVLLCTAMLTILIWSVGAWWFGLPTSESHSLVAALTGAALGSGYGGSILQWSIWLSVIGGMIGSVILGFSAAYLAAWSVGVQSQRKRCVRTGQVILAMLLAFTHGAQDGQKFLGILFLAQQLSSRSFGVVLPWTLACGLIMALGTMTGGRRIIEKIGNGLVELSREQGIIADGTTAICLLGASVLGFPVSTTHVKVAASVGTAAAGTTGNMHTAVIRELLLTWLLTFPGCIGLGYVLMRWFMVY